MDKEEKVILNIFVQTVVLHSLLRCIDPVHIVTEPGLDDHTLKTIKKAKEIANYVVHSNLNAS